MSIKVVLLLYQKPILYEDLNIIRKIYHYAKAYDYQQEEFKEEARLTKEFLNENANYSGDFFKVTRQR
ncbi:hypothetical protein KHA80_04855 [Anaerobacillus sp. HL2]|nr:hypothetical protein KHA80_04855 [Anaerobacillus sp. HL2]